MCFKSQDLLFGITKRVDPSYKSLSLQFIAYNRSILLNTLHSMLRQAILQLSMI